MHTHIEVYKSIIEHNPDAIIILSTNGTVMEVNQAACALFGYSKLDIQGVSYEKFMFPNHLAIVQQFDWVLQGDPIEVETVAFHKNGRSLYLRVKLIPIFVKKEVMGVYGVIKDVAELHQTKEILKNTEKRLQLLFNSTADAIEFLDIDGNVVDVNPAFEEIYGWKREEVIGNPMLKITTPQDEKTLSLVDKVKLGEAISGYYVKRMKKDGTNVDISLTLSPIFDSGEKVVAMSAITREITIPKALKESEERYRKVAEYSLNGIVLLKDEVILYANPFALNMVKEETLTGKSVYSYIRPNYHELSKKRLSDINIDKEIPFVEIQLNQMDGEVLDVELAGVQIDFDGDPATIVIIKDITKRKKAENTLRRSEEKYRLLAENTLDLIQLVNLDGIVTYASPSHKTVLGYKPEEYINKRVCYQANGKIDDAFNKSMFDLSVKHEPFTIEVARKHRAGYDVWLDLTGIPVFEDDGQLNYLMIVASEMTERKEHQKQLEFLSNHDALTGLPNRRLFGVQLKQSLKEADRYQRKVAIMFLDLDRFKKINDTYGHDAGDKLLKQFTNQLQECIRESDLLFRFGGDEFVILLPEAGGESEATIIAERIINSLQTPWKVFEHEFISTTSIGIAFYEQGDKEEVLLKKADIALYQAKSDGKNTYNVY